MPDTRSFVKEIFADIRRLLAPAQPESQSPAPTADASGTARMSQGSGTLHCVALQHQKLRRYSSGAGIVPRIYGPPATCAGIAAANVPLITYQNCSDSKVSADTVSKDVNRAATSSVQRTYD